MQDNTILYEATFRKVMVGEPLTIEEVKRWGKIITTQINISSPNQKQIEELNFNIRQQIKAVFDIK